MKDCQTCIGSGKIKEVYDYLHFGDLIREYSTYVVKRDGLITGIDMITIDNFLVWREKSDAK